jgi:antirestriction protein ArdC
MDIYSTITNRIVAQLEAGTIPWQKPWKGGRAGMPKNLLSQKEYRGINVLLLSVSGYESPYFLTFKQADSIGGHVNKGEKGTTIIKAVYKDDDTDPTKSRFRGLKQYTVFHTSQCTLPDSLAPLIAQPSPITPHERITQAEAIIAGMPNPPTFSHCDAAREKVAYYSPSRDMIQIPALSSYDQPEFYYCVAFHEMGHSTGHTKRLDRSTLTDSVKFGDTNYSKEELVAEMTAAFLCGTAGIEDTTISNSAAYIDGWLSKLRKDKTLLVTAAKDAQRASDYILNTTKESK